MTGSTMSTQVATTQQNELQKPAQGQEPAVVKELKAYLPRFAAVLPKHISADRFVRVCLSALNQNPKLLECDSYSLLQSALTAAQLGLEPDANLGQAYFVPFKDNKAGITRCQLIPGYKGYLALARNSGEVSSISARVVYANDIFELEFGLDEKLVHKPSLVDIGQEKKEQPITHVYCVIRFKDGSHHIEVMTFQEVEGIRLRSKMANSGPWVTDWAEMAKKTVIRRASKFMPLSVQKAATIENNAMAGNWGQLDDHGDVVIDVIKDPHRDPDIPEESTRLNALVDNLDAETQERDKTDGQQ